MSRTCLGGVSDVSRRCLGGVSLGAAPVEEVAGRGHLVRVPHKVDEPSHHSYR